MQSIIRRRVCKVFYIKKYSYELKPCFSKNGVGFNTEQAMVWLKEKIPEGLGTTNFPSDKYIKTKLSALKQ